MKKTLILLTIIFGFYFLISNVMAQSIKIPDDAIRIRVIANSNSDADQELKQTVRQDIEQYLYEKLDKANNVKEADAIISYNIPKINNIVNKYTNDYNVNYGMNYFPSKEYKGIKYDAGEYQSLVVTLGNGLGDNWWCVLFPPLCLLEAEDSSDVEYHSFVADMIEKYF